MEIEAVEALRAEWSGRQVVVDSQRPELRRFVGRTGRVVSISFNGSALVQFEGPDIAWYDIAPEFLRVVAKPAPDATLEGTPESRGNSAS